MRFTGMKRAKRDGDVKKFRMAHGEATLKEIGERFNLRSEERRVGKECRL